ncbi:Cell division protein FtsZ [Mesoflavibacter sp. HG96]|uniref:cell division protein FtsZ n=1 Tax=unclassified Mesoflavibacter TaxID=2630131 RepID=UPI000D0E7F76|nr:MULTISPECIES: cell division protein FtsZ [unclassified Mesoflavibacter]QIJ88468.1 Cell division protein FtsZ [Mesoflavibacter sp. HG96]QIJ91196.1 Cell division protein FtsZ [Mesoflavibacter sp. HG37]
MSNNEFESIAFDLPKNQSNVIKVIGVGGGGSNAINHMFQQGIKGVDFVICNTDAQALQNSGVPNKIQLGVNLTEGLGAGANPNVGEQAAVESFEDIQMMLDTNTKMVFITAGMGGGTGTGAAPIIAKMAKDLDILTVGIVTMPFQFEGKMRNEQAQIGIERLRKEVDSLVVINNNKLREVYGNLGFKAGFSKADEVLATAARGIAEVITHHYTQNIDLRDAKTVLSNSGTAIMGSATAAGQNRAHEAISKALDSPLLNDNKITGAKNVLLLIVSGAQEITIDEIGEINDHIQNEAGHGANIIMGVGEDESLEESISVTVIATGFDVEQQNEISNTEAKKVIHALEDDQNMEQDLTGNEANPAIILPNIELEEKKENPIVKHTLEIEDEEEEIAPKANQSLSTFEMDQIKKQTVDEREIIPTSEFIKNLNVTYYEVDVNLDENQEFNITSTAKETETPEIKEDAPQNKQQTMLSFDMPISEEPTIAPVTEEDEGPIIMDLSQDVANVEVNDFVEVIPVTENTETGEKRYALDDYETVESAINVTAKVEEEEEIVFEKKTLETESNTTKEVATETEIDPMNTPISELLKSRAEERRQKMKSFNYKFNTSKIDDIEKVPAYKRQGLELDNSQHSSDNSISRTTLGVDENDEIQLRNNNSFLHDNVD